jgi:hypothetical protein
MRVLMPLEMLPAAFFCRLLSREKDSGDDHVND